MIIPSPQAYETLLADFAGYVGLDSETFVQTQEIVVDGLHVGLAYEGVEGFGDIIYMADLGAPVSERAPEIHTVLLEANNMWAGTGGATLGLQQETGHVIIAGRVEFKGATREGLATLLDAFVDTAEYWKRFVDGEFDRSELSAVGQLA